MARVHSTMVALGKKAPEFLLPDTISGKQISGKIVKNNANAIKTTLDVSGLSKGVYLVRIGNIDFQKVVKTILK